MTELSSDPDLTHQDHYTYLDDYQQWTLTKKRGGLLTKTHIVAGFGIGGEAGEVQEIIKKSEQKERPLNDDEVAHLAEELGDVLYYLAVLADHYGYDLSDIARINVDKLEARYPG